MVNGYGFSLRSVIYIIIMKSQLADYSIKLSLRIVAYYQWLTNDRREFVMSKQILRSGTSIGANIHEAMYAVSRADFINKMHIAAKEACETDYWLLILERSGYYDRSFDDLKDLLGSIRRMLTATLNTSKKQREVLE